MAEPTLLERREIEARTGAPLILAVMKEVGEERGLEILRGVITDLARDSGAAMAREFADATLPAFARGLERWKEGGALEIEMIEQTEDRLDFNVTRCRYAETYREMGLGDIGHLMSCNRDGTFCEGYDPNIQLERRQTIMAGAPTCTFRYSRRAP